jgi:hypothetical protein
VVTSFTQLYKFTSADGVTFSSRSPVDQGGQELNRMYGSPAGLVAGSLGVMFLGRQAGDSTIRFAFFLDGEGVPPVPAIVCGSPPDGRVGVAYSHTFPAAGGTAPYTFSVTAGYLPPGLSMTASTGAVAGMPTLYGVFPFTVTVTDSLAASSSVNCSITITADVVIQLIGWKLYPVALCDDALPVLEPPPVKRAV